MPGERKQMQIFQVGPIFAWGSFVPLKTLLGPEQFRLEFGVFQKCRVTGVSCVTEHKSLFFLANARQSQVQWIELEESSPGLL